MRLSSMVAPQITRLHGLERNPCTNLVEINKWGNGGRNCDEVLGIFVT
jgi:hypothetical protein